MTKMSQGVDKSGVLWYNKGIKSKGVGSMLTVEKFIVLDVEGMSGKRPYNVGYIIADRHGRIYAKHSFAFPAAIWENIAESLRIGQAIEMTKKNIQEILLDADKPVRKRKYKSMTSGEFTKLFTKEIRKHKIKRVFAYNVSFDKNAIFNLIGADAFDALGVEWCDIIGGILPRLLTEKYIRYCLTNGFLSKTGIASYKAEVVYRYLTGLLDFEEEHTGLADVLIEYFILLSAFKSHKKLNFNPVCAWAVLKRFMREHNLSAE